MDLSTPASRHPPPSPPPPLYPVYHKRQRVDGPEDSETVEEEALKKKRRGIAAGIIDLTFLAVAVGVACYSIWRNSTEEKPARPTPPLSLAPLESTQTPKRRQSRSRSSLPRTPTAQRPRRSLPTLDSPVLIERYSRCDPFGPFALQGAAEEEEEGDDEAMQAIQSRLEGLIVSGQAALESTPPWTTDVLEGRDIRGEVKSRRRSQGVGAKFGEEGRVAEEQLDMLIERVELNKRDWWTT